MLNPNTPVMPGAIRIWEREVEQLTLQLSQAEYKLAHARAYLDALRKAHEEQNK